MVPAALVSLQDVGSMSDDEAQGEGKKLEDAYAAELNDDDGFDEPSAKKAKSVAKPVWALFVKLTFSSADKVEAQRRYRSTDKRNVAIHGGVGGWDYGKKVMTQPCLHCGRPVEIAGTSTWWGLGRWSALDGCTDDHPTLIAGMEPKHEEDA